MSTKDKQLVGAAGEHLVLSRLLARGILAAQAPRGARKADILVNHLDGRAPCLIQVKTRSGDKEKISWLLNAKNEFIVDFDIFYCLVDLGEDNPSVYVIPAKKIASILKEGHSKWLRTPGAKGQQRNDSNIRRLSAEYSTNLKSAPKGWMDKYLENWDLIE